MQISKIRAILAKSRPVPDDKELGRRLRIARKSLGLTQAEAAEEMGISVSDVGAAESGKRVDPAFRSRFPSEILLRHYPDYMRMDGSSFDEDPVMALCRHEPALEKDRDVLKQLGFCLGLCRVGMRLKKSIGHPKPASIPSYKPRRPSSHADAVAQGEEIAAEERRRLGLGCLPVHNMVELIQSQDIWAACTQLPCSLSGIHIRNPVIGQAIFANASFSHEERRVSLAQQYAHALLSRSRIKLSRAANPKAFSDLRAESFAAGFLMPREGVEAIAGIRSGDKNRRRITEDEVREARKKKKDLKFDFTHLHYSPLLDAFRVAKHFKVSYRSAIIRLRDLDLITDEDLSELEGFKKQGFAMLDEFSIAGRKDPLDEQGFNQLRNKVMQLTLNACAVIELSGGRLRELSFFFGVDYIDFWRLGVIAQRE